MTKFTVFALVLSFCALTFAGCSTASHPGCCGCVEGNLCGWNFYKPADLVEGRAANGCRDLCADPCCEPGVRYSEAVVAPATPPASVSSEGNAAPAADATDVAEDGLAEFAPPAAAR